MPKTAQDGPRWTRDAPQKPPRGLQGGPHEAGGRRGAAAGEGTVSTRHELGATLVWQGRAFSAGGLRRGLQRWRRHAARKNYRRRAILRAQPLVRAARRALRRWQDIRRCEAVGIVAYYSAISRALGRALRRWAAEAMAVGRLRLLDMAWQGAQALAALRVWQGKSAARFVQAQRAPPQTASS